jgi:hypothetical protein
MNILRFELYWKGSRDIRVLGLGRGAPTPLLHMSILKKLGEMLKKKLVLLRAIFVLLIRLSHA